MTLRNITIPKAVVAVDAEQMFSVSGVTAAQVFSLYNRHREDLSVLFDRLAGRGDADASEVLNSIEGIISQFPLLVAETIALASGEKIDDADTWQEAVSIAQNLPFSVQTDALIKISELTFSPDMPPKKFFALLVGMIQQVGLTKTSVTGSGD
jgi:hypothetical protein